MTAEDTGSERPTYELDFHKEGFRRKAWSNPKRTTHRVYLHRFEGKQKVECGYVDLLNLSYVQPAHNRRNADYNIIRVTDKKQKADTIVTLTVGKDTLTLGYEGAEQESKQDSKQDSKPAPTEKTVAQVKGEVSNPTRLLEHLASVTKADTKVIISYGNTVEVKSRHKSGFIQSQYPKFSLTVELDGGNTLPKLNEAADAVVDIVETKLTELIKNLINSE